MLKAIHKARFVLAEPDLLLQNAAVHVSNPGRISRIEPWQDPPAVPEVELIDWGSALIMPGLINSHTHLELTAFKNQLTRFRSFTDWISQLVDRRRLWTKEQFLNSIQEGSDAALSSGTTLVADVSACGYAWEAAIGGRLRRVIFEEALSLLPGKADEIARDLQAKLASGRLHPLLSCGISPHAPYSVSPDLYRRLAELSRREGLLLATHVAETKAEVEFLQSGTGEFRDFLDAMGALPENWSPPGLRPIPYLDSLGVLGPSAILIHCNYLHPESMNRILNTRSSVVYCPRSHDFFGHEKHAVRELLNFGVNVGLGTDSLASNASLSMLDEMRYLYKTRKDIKPEEILRMATLNGAAALNFGGVLGRLRRGYWADLAVLELPENIAPRQLLSQVLEGAGEPVATVVQGTLAWQHARLGRQNSR